MSTKNLSIGLLEQMATLLKLGQSSRTIAKKLGCSKSTVNNWRQTLKIGGGKQGAKVKILDVETAATISAHFGRFNINIGQANVVKEGGWILCAAWRDLGSSETTGISLTKEEVRAGDDSRIVKELWKQFEEADVIIAHNANGFDVKVIRTRCLANGLAALPTVQVIDTLALAKKFLKLPSNKLDDIGAYFKLGRKFSTGGIALWISVQSGDELAMIKMLTYCIQDVDLLHDVYLKIRSVGGSAYNAGLYYDDLVTRCKTCGSDDLEKTGRKSKTSVNSFDEYKCLSCGSVHRGRENKTTTAKRKSLLS